MFITETDYKIVIGERSLEVIQQSDDTNRQEAEKTALEEISGFLRPKYDTAAIFAAQGEARSKLIIMLACDIALYHLASWLPNKMNMELRQTRYDSAIKRLRQIQSGEFIPDLPVATDTAGEEVTTVVAYGSQEKHDNSW